MKEHLQKGYLYVPVTNRLGLREIVAKEDCRFEVLDREVILSHPSKPFMESVMLEPDLSRESEDLSSSRGVICALVQRCTLKNLRTIGKNTGFVVWSSQRHEYSEHLIQRNDYIQVCDVHMATIQFFKYRFAKT